jgi:hypothetical protein
MGLLTKREVLDLASLAITDREDVRAARATEATARAALEVASAALRECWKAQGGNDSALSPPNQRDAILAAEAADREPELRRDENRRKIEVDRAVRHREAVEKTARTEGRAAMLPAVKAHLEAIDALLAELPEACHAALAALAEIARKLELPSTGYEGHAYADWFVGTMHQESAFEFRRRLAVDAGLLPKR